MELVKRANHATAERFDAYRTAISEAFVPLTASLDAGTGFDAVMRNQDVGALTFSDIQATQHVVSRTARGIRESDPAYFKLGLQVSGYSVLSQDGREAALTPGDFAFYDTSRPYSLAFDNSYRMLVVMFPRAFLRLPERPVAALTARRISGRHGTGAFLSPLLLRLAQQTGGGDPAVTVPVGEAIVDLLAATLAEQIQLTSSLPSETHQRALTMRIRAFIAERLGDAELSPGRIAEAHHISVRYLHRLFEAEGDTVGGWIRGQRLEHCRRDLTDPRYFNVAASTIAARWGLSNPAHFSRLFRSAFGVTPGQYRSEALERS